LTSEFRSPRSILWVGQEPDELEELTDRFQFTFTHPDQNLTEIEAKTKPDLIIVDLTRGNPENLQLLTNLGQYHFQSPVMGLVGSDKQILTNAVEAGLQDILFTPIRPSELENRTILAAQRLASLKAYNRISSHIQQASVSMNLPTDFGLVAPVANILTRDLKPSGQTSDEQIFHLRLILSELLTNAMEHGSLGISLEEKQKALEKGRFDQLLAERMNDSTYSSRRVFVSMERSAAEIRYTIRDQGPGFDVAKVMAQLADPHPTIPSGRGLFFLKTFVDEYHFAQGGREVTLTKYLKPVSNQG